MLAYTRELDNYSRFLIVLNLTHRPCYFRPENFSFRGTVEIATFPEMEGKVISDNISLDGDEALLIRLE